MILSFIAFSIFFLIGYYFLYATIEALKPSRVFYHFKDYPLEKYLKRILPKTYKPNFYFPGCVFKAFHNATFRTNYKKIYKRYIVKQDDGSEQALDIYPKDFSKGEGFFILILPGHGYSSEITLYTNMAKLGFKETGYPIGVMNHRGVGGVRLNATKNFNWYLDDDIVAIIQKIEELGFKKIFICGTSHGGGRIPFYIKVLKEKKMLDRIIATCAIGAAYDWRVVIKNLSTSRSFNILAALNMKLLLLNCFDKETVKNANSKEKNLWKLRFGVREYYEQVVEVCQGEKIDDFYKRVSDTSLLKEMEVPHLVIHGEDDTVCSLDQVPIEIIKNKKNMNLMIVERGGHVSFLHGPQRMNYAFLACVYFFRYSVIHQID